MGDSATVEASEIALAIRTSSLLGFPWLSAASNLLSSFAFDVAAFCKLRSIAAPVLTSAPLRSLVTSSAAGACFAGTCAVAVVVAELEKVAETSASRVDAPYLAHCNVRILS